MSRLSKLIYIILILALLAHPHFITSHVFSIPQAYAQSLTSFFLILIAYIIYIVHKNEILRKDKEKNSIERKLNLSKSELSESFKYIGLVNRRLSLFKTIISGSLNKSGQHRKTKKQVLDNLLSTAVVSITKSDGGLLRFVDVNKQKTINEFLCVLNKRSFTKIKISNNYLCSTANKQNDPELDKLSIFYSSDQEANIRCFLILDTKNNPSEETHSILQAITDQARLFHKYLFNDRE